MAIERCDRCGRYVDLDQHVEEIEYIGGSLVPVCDCCWTDEERTKIEREHNKTKNENLRI